MIRWEYGNVASELTLLNDMGSEGWELVRVDGPWALLRRPYVLVPEREDDPLSPMVKSYDVGVLR